MTTMPLAFLAQSFLNNPLFLIVIFAAIWIPLVILPTRKEKKAREAMQQNLAKGDRVLVQAGMIGKVSQTKGDTVTLDFGGAKIPFLRSTVVKVMDKEDE